MEKSKKIKSEERKERLANALKRNIARRKQKRTAKKEAENAGAT